MLPACEPAQCSRMLCYLRACPGEASACCLPVSLQVVKSLGSWDQQPGLVVACCLLWACIMQHARMAEGREARTEPQHARCCLRMCAAAHQLAEQPMGSCLADMQAASGVLS